MVSIFNDVIGPVMRGSSSSHCAAALRIGRLARDLMDGQLRDVLVQFDRAGSLPTTHESQGSDMGLCGGLLGWDAADERLPASVEAIQRAGVTVRFEIVDTGDPHPNTYRLTLTGDRDTHTLIAISTGGGMMTIIDIDGFEVSIAGDYFLTLVFTPTASAAGVGAALTAAAEQNIEGLLIHEQEGRALVEVRTTSALADAIVETIRATAPDGEVRRLAPVLPVLSRANLQVPFRSANALVSYAAGRERPLWQWALDYECARGGLSEAEVTERMVDLIRLWRRSIAQGIAGTSYDDRLVGHQSGVFETRLREGRLLDAGPLNRAVLYVTALMEVKSAMGVIVAAPTAGACAALPGVTLAMAEHMARDDEETAHALLAAGLIGVFIADRWTFAAEVGGCQAEGGSAAAMAAAALVTLAAGTTSQALAASSLALQSMLGLICDPVAGRVEVPCLGKNVLAASHALSSANMALADFDPVIPFDEVVDAAARVAERMPREVRCTSEGGLAATPTARALEGRLVARKLAGCGVGCGCH